MSLLLFSKGNNSRFTILLRWKKNPSRLVKLPLLVTFEPKVLQGENEGPKVRMERARSKDPSADVKGPLLQDHMLNEMKTAQFKNLGFSNVGKDKNQQSTGQKVVSMSS